MMEKIVALVSLTIYVHYATAFVKDGGSRFFNFKINISDFKIYDIREQIKENLKRNTSFKQNGDLVPYPIEVDPDWDKETQIEFIKSFENEKDISDSVDAKKDNLDQQQGRAVGGGDPLKDSSGLVGTSDNKAYGALSNFFISNTCPPLYACRSPTFGNKCCTFKFENGKYYCDYQACYSFF